MYQDEEPFFVLQMSLESPSASVDVQADPTSVPAILEPPESAAPADQSMTSTDPDHSMSTTMSTDYFLSTPSTGKDRTGDSSFDNSIPSLGVGSAEDSK